MPRLRDFISTYWLDSILIDREILRLQGKYTEADNIRDLLKTIGIILIDTKEGTMWYLELRNG